LGDENGKGSAGILAEDRSAGGGIGTEPGLVANFHDDEFGASVLCAAFVGFVVRDGLQVTEADGDEAFAVDAFVDEPGSDGEGSFTGEFEIGSGLADVVRMTFDANEGDLRFFARGIA